MVGFFGYVGTRDAIQVVHKGLRYLEYHTYDYTEFGYVDQRIRNVEGKGSLKNLFNQFNSKYIRSKVAQGAFVLRVNEDKGADYYKFPSTNKTTISYTGSIDNLYSLKEIIDEVIYLKKIENEYDLMDQFMIHLQKHEQYTPEQSIIALFKKLEGHFAISIISELIPEKIYVYSSGRSALVGIEEDEMGHYIASEQAPLIQLTQEWVSLKKGEYACVSVHKMEVFDLATGAEKKVNITTLDDKIVDKERFPHFMLKEIFEQPLSIRQSLNGRVFPVEGRLELQGFEKYVSAFDQSNRVVLIATGTSYHACLIAEYIFEEFARIPVEVEYASEFRYRNPIVGEKDIFIAVSQSGETADTIASVDFAKKSGATVLGVCNNPNSSLANESHAVFVTQAGPEFGIASTRAYTAQMSVLVLMAMMVAQHKKTMSDEVFRNLLFEIESIPSKIERVLSNHTVIQEIAERFKDTRTFAYLGRGYNYPVALEGALKLREIANIHAEAYPAAEVKNGPIALVDESMPVVVIATHEVSYNKIVSNIREVKARKARVIAIVTEGDTVVPALVNYVIEVPRAHEALTPLITVIPMQLLSYYMAVLRGFPVDSIKNIDLAQYKISSSSTVESLK